MFLIVAALILLSSGCVTNQGNNHTADVSGNGYNSYSEGDFEVTEELYVQTFSEIEDLIETLNGIIARRDYRVWKQNLSGAYLEKFSDPDYLATVSETPVFIENEIVLEDLNDYFEWVVVPSRSDVRLDEIIFKDENHVKAYMIIEERRTILYYLERIDGEWKISIW
jgi:hypothetical protein